MTFGEFSATRRLSGRFRAGLSVRFLLHLLVMALAMMPALASAEGPPPTRDIPAAKDSPALKRYEGSFIVGYTKLAYTDFKVPLSKLEPTERLDVMNNKVEAPKKEQELEGALTRLVYVLPADRSPFEVLRNYQDEIEAGGGSVLFTCKAEGCGGDHTRSSYGGGGTSSLMMYFFRDADIKDPAFSNGACAVTSTISDQRFMTAKRPDPDGDTWVTVQTFQVDGGTYCKQLNGRTVALVHVLEPKARDRKMTTVKADEMAKSIGSTGKVTLYGILFDTDKTEVKAGSEPTLQEIASLLKADPRLAVIIVGHTDNQGAYDYNLDLSRRRAEAVVKVLSASYAIDAKRLRPAGVGMVAPAASNDDEAGRSKNRRVELVKLN
jgi:OOP family OmpA-OmpF porin